MNTAVINIKTQPEVKEKAQKIAQEMGLTLTSIMNRYLKHFIHTKTITFQLEEEPSNYLLSSMKRAEKNLKEGNTSPAFDDIKANLTWLKKQGI